MGHTISVIGNLSGHRAHWHEHVPWNKRHGPVRCRCAVLKVVGLRDVQTSHWVAVIGRAARRSRSDPNANDRDQDDNDEDSGCSHEGDQDRR